MLSSPLVQPLRTIPSHDSPHADNCSLALHLTAPHIKTATLMQHELFMQCQMLTLSPEERHRVHAGNTGVQGPLPTWSSAAPLQSLSAAGAKLTGVLPFTAEGLQSLTYLDLSSNALTGTVSDALGLSGFLYHLDLSSNAFTGAHLLGLLHDSQIAQV